MKKLLSLALALMLVLATPLGVLAEGGDFPPSDEQVLTEPESTPPPTQVPTEAPTPEPTQAPTQEPAQDATQEPTEAPSQDLDQEPAPDPTEGVEPAPEPEALSAPSNLRWDDDGNIFFDTVVPATDRYLVTVYCDGQEVKRIFANDVPGNAPSLMILSTEALSEPGEYTFTVVALGFDGYLDSAVAESTAFQYEPGPVEDPYAELDAISALVAMVEAGELTILEAREALLAIPARDIEELVLNSRVAADALSALEALYMQAAGIALSIEVDEAITGAQLVGTGLNAWESPQELRMYATVKPNDEYDGSLRVFFALEAIQPEPNPPIANSGALRSPVYVTIPLAKGVSANEVSLTNDRGETVLFSIQNNKIGFVITSLGEYKLSHAPMATATRSLAQIQAFVTRLYVNVLGRQPDAKGLSEWSNGLATGVITGAQACAGFYTSPELAAKNLTDRQFIDNLYRTCLNRAPDTNGLNGWVKVLSDGATRISVMNGFIVSPEFNKICQNYGIVRGTYDPPNYRDKNMNVTMFVVRLYRNFLGREPDTTGLESWCRTLIGVGQSGSQVAWGFYSSREFQRKGLTDDQFVTVLYNTLLNRVPDAAGLSSWKRSIAIYGYQSVFTGFIVSQEWKALMTMYGINAAAFTPPAPTYRALIIGQYRYSDHYLLGCDRDATAMNNLLGRTVPAYQRTVARDQTAAKILSSIGTTFAGAQETDISLFYYSGHGYGSSSSVTNGGALCGVDTNPYNWSGDVTPTQLRNALDAVPGKVIVILDSCFSGSYIRAKDSGGKDDGAPLSDQEAASIRAKALNNFNDAFINAFSGGEITDYWSVDERDSRYGELKTSKYVVLTAARWNETSEGANFSSAGATGSGGVFTSYLSLGAGWNPIANVACSLNADTNNDGTVSVNEAYLYVQKNTTSWDQNVVSYSGSSIYPLFKFK